MIVQRRRVDHVVDRRTGSSSSGAVIAPEVGDAAPSSAVIIECVALSGVRV